MQVQKLSRRLHSFNYCIGDAVKLENTTKGHIQRMHDLMTVMPAQCAKEVGFMIEFINKNNKELKGKRLEIVAVEYSIDDGRLTKGVGDMLLYRYGTNVLYVVECKMMSGCDERKKKMRYKHVQEQANKYVERVRSWLRHLSEDDSLCNLRQITVEGVILTDEKGWIGWDSNPEP